MADYWLIVQHDGVERRFRLDSQEVTLGQAADCGVRVSHPTVSRHHASLRRDGDGYLLRDLGSTNGSFVDGTRVAERHVAAGAALRFGDVAACISRRSTADLPLRIDLDAAVDPVPGTATQTLLGGAPARFVLGELPPLIASLRSGQGAGVFARAALAALVSVFPGLSLRISRRQGGGEILLAGAADLDPAAPTLSVQPFRFTWDATDAPAELPALLRLLGELLGLAEGADPVSEAPVRSPPPLPSPPSNDTRFREIYRLAARIGPARDINVLIEGESGTGKEVLAGYLHACAGGGPMLALNCAALPRDLLEAELFGIERGVATGVDARPGKFEQADGGTLFLDEIGEMPADMQAKLLRVLQDGLVVRLGARVARRIDVRIVAATNRDLAALVESGGFRRDLYHRVADWSVVLPPLRERPGDLLGLAAHFLEDALRRRGIASSGLGADAVAALRAYGWPGNVRELDREMRRAALFLDNGQILDVAQLSERVQEARERGGGRESRLEEAQVRAAISEACGNMSAAAERLGVARSTLYRRLKTLGIEP